MSVDLSSLPLESARLERPRRLAGRPLAAALGVVAVLGNLLGVLWLHEMPAAYRPAALDAWVHAVSEQPRAALASSLSFCIGLLALSLWSLELRARLGGAGPRAGAALVAIAAALDAGGTLAPLVQSYHVGVCGPPCDAVGRALLGGSLALDALFNLALGAGLLAVATSPDLPRWLRGLAVAAGLASLPVAAQAVWDPAASLLYVAAPLWLVFVLSTSIGLARTDA